MSLLAFLVFAMEFGCMPKSFCSQRNMIREATAFLLDVLKPNLPEHAFLQTKVSSCFFPFGYECPCMWTLFVTQQLLSECTVGFGDKLGDIPKCC